MKNIIHNYDTVVLGATLEALLYAYLHGLPLFYSVAKRPFDFETLEIDDNFWGSLNHENVTTTIKTNNGDVILGSSKQAVWDKLFFLLAFCGLIPCTNVQSLRLDDDLIKISTHNNKLIKIKPKNIILFDDEDVEGLTRAYKMNNRLVVYDFVQFNSITRNINLDLIQTEWDYASKIWFLEPSNKLRACDGCIISYAKNQVKLQNELTDYILHFTLKKVFKSLGIKGRLNGFDKFGKRKYKPIEYQFTSREVRKEKPHFYHDWDNVKSMTHITIDDILKEKRTTNYAMYIKCLNLTQKTGPIKGLSTLQE